MKRNIIVTLLVISLLAMCLPLAACTKSKEEVIRLNEVTHSVFYAPLYVAINEGYFEEQGLTIELTNGGGADKTMTAVLSGQADIGFCGPEASIYVYNEGKKNYPIVIGHSNAIDRAKQFEEELKEAGIPDNFITNCIGPIVGTHIGPNCLGIGYIRK